MELTFLLMWGMLRSREVAGHGNAGCPKPPNITFAEIVIDRITVGSKVRYTCEVGYKRKLGQTDVFVCVNDTGLIYWNITTTSICIADSSAMPRQSEKTPHSTAVGNPVTIVPSDTTGYCGIPRSMEHARYRMTKYGVGQELNYRCLSGYVAQSPTFAISVCKKDGDKLLWKELRLECTNDSKSGEETTQPIPVTDTPKPCHILAAKLSVTEIAIASLFLMIFIILGSLLLKKLWARMRSTPEVKIEKPNPILTTAARVEKESEEEAQRLKSNV